MKGSALRRTFGLVTALYAVIVVYRIIVSDQLNAFRVDIRREWTNVVPKRISFDVVADLIVSFYLRITPLASGR